MGGSGGGAAIAGRADGRGFELVLGGKVGAALRPISDRLCTRTHVKRGEVRSMWRGFRGSRTWRGCGQGKPKSQDSGNFLESLERGTIAPPDVPERCRQVDHRHSPSKPSRSRPAGAGEQEEEEAAPREVPRLKGRSSSVQAVSERVQTEEEERASRLCGGELECSWREVQRGEKLRGEEAVLALCWWEEEGTASLASASEQRLPACSVAVCTAARAWSGFEPRLLSGAGAIRPS